MKLSQRHCMATGSRRCVHVLLISAWASCCSSSAIADAGSFGSSWGMHPRNLLLSSSAGAHVASCMDMWREALPHKLQLGRMSGLDRVLSETLQQGAAFGVSSISASVVRNLQQLSLALPNVGSNGDMNVMKGCSGEELAAMNERLHARLEAVLAPDGWETVLRKEGVEVARKRVHGLYKGGEKFYAVKAEGVLRAEPRAVFEILRDSQRVDEYNRECAGTEDVARMGADTKIMWACSKTYFPFKPRDFVTRVHSLALPDGTFVIASESPEEEVPTPRAGSFVRTKVLVSGSVMRPVEGHPELTHFTTVGHINPGGAADTPVGAQLANKICIFGPVSFIRRLELTAQSPPAPASAAAAR